MPSLHEALSALSEDGETYVVEAPEGWTTGRTVYGGMTAALCAHASVLKYPDMPPLRSAHFTFIGPASGTLRLRPEMLRRGGSTAVTSVECYADAALASRATLTYGVDRTTEVAHDLVPIPEVAGPGACPPFMALGGAPRGFFRYFETRLAAGSRPMMQSDNPQFTAWVQLLQGAGVEPLIALIAIADSLPPAAMASFSRAGSISTMTWSVDFRHPIPPSDWFLLRSVSEQCAGGYSQQAMDAWASDGTRVATSRQTVAVFV